MTDEIREGTDGRVIQVAVRAKLDREKEERRKARAIASGEEVPKKPSALDRFKRSS